MSCSFNDAKDHICKVFSDVWGPLGYPATYSEVAPGGSTEGDTPSVSLWARVTIRHAEGFQSSLTDQISGQKRYTNTGTAFIQIFGAIGDGSTSAYDAAQIVASAYRMSRGIPVWFRNVRINELGVKGVYNQINVMADFSYDDLR